MAAASAWGKAWGAAFGAAWGASGAAPVQPAQPASVYLGDGRGRRRIISPAPPLRRHRTRRQREHSDLLLIFKP